MNELNSKFNLIQKSLRLISGFGIFTERIGSECAGN
ncbi:conserved hypothetical protein [Vibrio cholerae O1 str. 2010EL-1786]|uniref:Uncharacterized protein n=2 Tax=Vibrio cholerae TaxID=666 RepID=Q9KNU1_VIBCH|nr:hypothetical protein VC_2639 [Vibrio cholerae O1 biovar El Tor str. N16961]ACP06855.1 conserved hypothetical protein [Vibrio cholerae M66-2]ACP10737.1 conserved hypothetical protein [Vibrio cholerae O395]AET27718.1 conserved hypothetical protein [Vibrio cholerae O1 str. 2010EL-1786]CSB62599.1 Uncharacterised protein [Vibrio cholerae]